MTGLVLLTAVGTAVGLWLIVVGLWPRPPRLDKALAALDPPPEPAAPVPDELAGWSARVGRPAVRHLQRIRDLQDQTSGFFAFIPWTFQRENTALGRKIKNEPTGIDYLKMLAVSVLFLDNIENFQSSWLTQGLRLGQVALRFGANDMGSIMIEENVVSAAGAHNRSDEKTLRYLISEAGFIPQQRDILYRHVDRQPQKDTTAPTSQPKRVLKIMTVA